MDAAGEVQADGLNHYLYDAEGRICAVQNSVGGLTGYVYDAAGTRVAAGSLTSFSCNFASNGYSTTKSWVLGPGGEQVTEYAVAAGVSSWTHTNVFAGAKLDATYNGADTYFALSDWLGTKRVEVDAAGACATGYRSLPFGEQLAPAAVTVGGVAMPVCATDATEHHFTGKEHDAETGNDYFGARYFNSGMGRWLSPDWSAKEEPVPYAKLDDPQTLNLYGYVGNNPLARFDADGHDWPSWGDVANFVSAASNAFASDNAFGVGRQEQTTAAGRMGAAFGDFGAAVQGAVETVSGGSQMGGGVALCGTGAGCLVGAPEAVVGTAVATHGVAVAGQGATHLAMALAKPASGKGSVPKEDRAPKRTATEKEKVEMKQEQNGNCAHCNKPLGDEKGDAHHDPIRHSDGGTEMKLVHHVCHLELHSAC